MPRRYEARPIAERGETNLALRIERLRREREWSYETLARKMTEAGCTISKAALYSIEQGNPRRRITVDELMAFAEIFVDGDVAELLTPMELVEQRRAHELIERLQGQDRRLGALSSEVFEICVDLFGLIRENRELYDYVMNQFHAKRARTTPEARWSAREDEVEPYQEVVQLRALQAIEDFRSALLAAASVWVSGQHEEITAEHEGQLEAELTVLRERYYGTEGQG
jgi:transcriptional regulator with XRE-family HTH domain